MIYFVIAIPVYKFEIEWQVITRKVEKVNRGKNRFNT